MMSFRTVKITSKGQATIPKEIRDLLNSDVVEFEVVEGTVVIKPVHSVGASLKGYSKGRGPLKDIREAVWGGAVRERASKKTT